MHLKIPMKNSINKILLILLGLCMLSIFIWVRFIRERLPREIPFNLTTLGFLILIYICASYIYMITALIFKPTSTPTSEALTALMSKIFIPLKTLDDFLKTRSFIKPYYLKFLSYAIKSLKKVNYTYLYLTLEISPRIILLSALLVDTFYFHLFFSYIKCSL
jgi:hypothetical protein